MSLERMKAVAVVPSYNEERVIADTVSALRELDGVERVVVVDDVELRGGSG